MNATIPGTPGTLSFGDLLRLARERRGMPQATLGGLVGKSARWVGGLESGRIQQPKVPTLLRLAEALRVDVADFGIPATALRLFAGPGHPALPAVREAINTICWPGDEPAESLSVLQARLDAAWRARHASPDHRTVLGALLPGLIRDGQRAVRAYSGDEGRRARAIMAGIWNLSQFFLAYQPDGGLLWRVAERAMAVALESESPRAIGASTWLLTQTHRDASEFEAAESMNVKVLEFLRPRLDGTGDEVAAIYGALLFEAGYTAARCGSPGAAWRYWDQADAVAQKLPRGYYDRMTSFSRTIMPAHAVTVAVEAQQRGEAARHARQAAQLAIPSAPRRARHQIEVARAHDMAGDPQAALATLKAAYRTAPETIRYNAFAGAMTAALAARGPAALRQDAVDLAERIGIAV